jgi:hypothetical protein
VSPANSALLARVALRAMTHTYTRTPVTPGAVNNHNEATLVEGTPVSGVVCLFGAKDTLVADPAGDRTVSVPVLRIAPSDPLAVGDLVSDILDRNGAVLLAGPLVVETIDEGAQAGASVMRTATLRGTDVRLGGG